MSNTSFLQMAAVAPVETLGARFAKLAELDHERNELTQGLLNRIFEYEQQIHRLSMDLEDQTKSRMTYQREARTLQEQARKIEHMINKDGYVVVLVDGDGAKFLDGLLRDPLSGAAEAAQRLKQEVKDYLKDTPLGAADLPILVRVFANLNDLAWSLRFSNVIESADNMRIFAEQFTNSRAEFDFVNVGRGKENADSKMRKMFNHFFKNIQCRKIFFAGCHDAGYVHDLREYVGDADAEERIVLLETTPAEPRFRSLGFPMTCFSTVFRSEPLGNERKRTNAPLPGPPFFPSAPPYVEMSAADGAVSGRLPPPAPGTGATMARPAGTDSPSPAPPGASPVVSRAQLLSPTANVTVSSNGGTSINYPPSYAAAGGADGHQNMTVQAAKTKKTKTIEYNKGGHRLDPPSRNPGFNNPAQLTYKAKWDRVRPRAFCNNHYLAGNCKWGDKCDFDHSTSLTPEEVAIHRYRARTSLCPAGPSCDDYSCYLSHHCTLQPHCARGLDCKFKKTKYGDLHLSGEDLVPATRWTEGFDFPTSL